VVPHGCLQCFAFVGGPLYLFVFFSLKWSRMSMNSGENVGNNTTLFDKESIKLAHLIYLQLYLIAVQIKFIIKYVKGLPLK
jgi:hypothetical protein